MRIFPLGYHFCRFLQIDCRLESHIAQFELQNSFHSQIHLLLEIYANVSSEFIINLKVQK